MTSFVTADIPAYACADSLLEQCWRETVGAEDVVYVIVGDGAEWVLPQLEQLPGQIRLVPHVMRVEEDFILSPTPLGPREFEAGRINLHGRSVSHAPALPRQLCVSIDTTGFRPITLAEARARATHLNEASRSNLRRVSAVTALA